MDAPPEQITVGAVICGPGGHAPVRPGLASAFETKLHDGRLGGETAACGRKFGYLGVATYRLYCLDGANKVASAEWIDADDDKAAIEAAKILMDGHDCELWERTRLVVRIPHGRSRR